MQEALVGQPHFSVWPHMCECIGTTKYTLWVIKKKEREKVGRGWRVDSGGEARGRWGGESGMNLIKIYSTHV